MNILCIKFYLVASCCAPLGYSWNTSSTIQPVFVEEKYPPKCHLMERINCRALMLRSLNAWLEVLVPSVGDRVVHTFSVPQVMQAAGLMKSGMNLADYKCVANNLNFILQRVYVSERTFEALVQLNGSFGMRIVKTSDLNTFWMLQKMHGFMNRSDSLCSFHLYYAAAISPEVAGRPFSDIMLGSVEHPSLTSKGKVVVPSRCVMVKIVEQVRMSLNNGIIKGIRVRSRRGNSTDETTNLPRTNNKRTREECCYSDESAKETPNNDNEEEEPCLLRKPTTIEGGVRELDSVVHDDDSQSKSRCHGKVDAGRVNFGGTVRAQFLEEELFPRCQLGVHIYCKASMLNALDALLEMLNDDGGDLRVGVITVPEVIKAANIKGANITNQVYACVYSTIRSIFRRVYVSELVASAVVELNQSAIGVVDGATGISRVNYLMFNAFWASKLHAHVINMECELYTFYSAAINPRMVGQPFTDVITGTVVHPSFASVGKVVVPSRSVFVKIVEKFRNSLWIELEKEAASKPKQNRQTTNIDEEMSHIVAYQSLVDRQQFQSIESGGFSSLNTASDDRDFVPIVNDVLDFLGPILDDGFFNDY